jgi:hypothetical protein
MMRSRALVAGGAESIVSITTQIDAELILINDREGQRPKGVASQKNGIKHAKCPFQNFLSL